MHKLLLCMLKERLIYAFFTMCCEDYIFGVSTCDLQATVQWLCCCTETHILAHAHLNGRTANFCSEVMHSKSIFGMSVTVPGYRLRHTDLLTVKLESKAKAFHLDHPNRRPITKIASYIDDLQYNVHYSCNTALSHVYLPFCL